MLKRAIHGVYALCAAIVFVAVTLLVCLIVIAGPTLAIRRELGRLGVRVMLASIGVPLIVRGREHLPAGRCIVVANHASYLDGLVLTAALPRRFSFVVQDGAARWPIVGLTLRRMGVIFVNRASAQQSAQLTRQLMRRLYADEPIAIFPEGTFKPEPGLLRFKDGAFVIAARTAAPVVPAGIRGTRRLYGGGRHLPRWSVVRIEFAAALSAQGSGREAALALRDRVRARVLALCGEVDRAGTDAPS
ncbi:lysophospholipid acyltransferase family protein [Sinimarinibacterium thermocellulolyticum]|uniref:Lysophospholipid acyltransferase family protein n=1 Tax=Sinimarinibacterium thermocellulolyticum TaxID=3170016 RepID=A0ABV2AB33_9GAMM